MVTPAPSCACDDMIMYIKDPNAIPVVIENG